MKKLRSAIAILLAPVAFAAWADAPGAAVFLAEGGVTAHSTYSLTAGVAFPWRWRREIARGEWTAATELYVSHWSARLDGARHSFTQVGLSPVVRYRFDEGRSDWFAEGGVGVSYLDALYQRDGKRFSTRFNFQTNLGVGRSFGAQREHELELRLAHVSNAGIKEPNPGENFVQLRYARRF